MLLEPALNCGVSYLPKRALKPHRQAVRSSSSFTQQQHISHPPLHFQLGGVGPIMAYKFDDTYLCAQELFVIPEFYMDPRQIDKLEFVICKKCTEENMNLRTLLLSRVYSRHSVITRDMLDNPVYQFKCAICCEKQLKVKSYIHCNECTKGVAKLKKRFGRYERLTRKHFKELEKEDRINSHHFISVKPRLQFLPLLGIKVQDSMQSKTRLDDKKVDGFSACVSSSP